VRVCSQRDHAMFNAAPFEFGYSWSVAYGLVVPLAIAAGLGALAWWRGWPRWVLVVAGLVVLWAVTGLVLINAVFGLNRPMPLPTERFLASGSGRVLDAGAGSGRAAVGVLLARPKATVTGLDIYTGYWGIEGNTPDRFMTNARIAGAAHRAEARIGDMREMPFREAEFDAVVSAYAIDHLSRDGSATAIAEVARVLKPRGEFLLMIVNADWLARLVSPHALAHHPRQDPARWHALLEQSGFQVEEEGRRPATLYFFARKRQQLPQNLNDRRKPRVSRATTGAT
jgi:SAM-dependent methyltransferase